MKDHFCTFLFRDITQWLGRNHNPLDFLVDQPAGVLAGNFELTLPNEKPKLLDSGRTENK
jgi:hypothetical protein